MAKAARPLPNRVAPDGTIHAVGARGTMMGNRGGRIHDRDSQVLRRRWASRQWITCVLAFKNRRRQVMGQGYTELFFLDEATALAAGHRPCFECRRQDALAFQAAFSAAQGAPDLLKAPAMDLILHQERLVPDSWQAPGRALPDGTMVRYQGQPHLIWTGRIMPWSFAGYGVARPFIAHETYGVMTPRCTVAALSHGFQPRIHPSAVT